MGDLIHNDLITENLSHKIIGHAGKDAAFVAGREKSCRKNSHGKKHNKKRGRPVKGVVVEKEPRRLEFL